MKRKCVFTNEDADKKLLVIPKNIDPHNWARYVPVSTDYLNSRDENADLSDLELKLVDCFFQQELLKIKIAHIDTKMQKIRRTIQQQKTGFSSSLPILEEKECEINEIEQAIAQQEDDIINKTALAELKQNFQPVAEDINKTPPISKETTKELENIKELDDILFEINSEIDKIKEEPKKTVIKKLWD